MSDLSRFREYTTESVADIFYGGGDPLPWYKGSVTRQLGGTTYYDPYRAGGEWRKNMKLGSEVTTDFVGTQLTYKGSQIEYSVKKKTPTIDGLRYGWGLRGDIGVSLPTPLGVSESPLYVADSIAREMISQKILGVQRKFQSGVFLGEMREVIRLIRNPLSAIFDKTNLYTSTLKKGFSSGGVKTLSKRKHTVSIKDAKRIVSDQWLQYQFGVVPLFNDIHNAAEAASQIITHRRPHETVVGTGRNRTGFLRSVYLDTQQALQVEYCKESFSSAEVKYKARVEVSNDTSQDNLESLGLTWGNFIPTVWELLPYSFLVDYFTNCGKVIDSLSINESRLRWCVKGTKLSNVEQIAYTKGRVMDPDYEFVMNSDAGSPAVYERSIMTRVGGQGLPIPSLRFKNPFRKPLKVANMVALIVSNGRSASQVLRV